MPTLMAHRSGYQHCKIYPRPHYESAHQLFLKWAQGTWSPQKLYSHPEAIFIGIFHVLNCV